MVADVAHMLHTPVTELLEMDLRDFMEWHHEAARIAKVRGF
jgi:hypothetical protein